MKRWLKIMLVIFICATILTGIGVGLEIGIYGVQSYACLLYTSGPPPFTTQGPPPPPPPIRTASSANGSRSGGCLRQLVMFCVLAFFNLVVVLGPWIGVAAVLFSMWFVALALILSGILCIAAGIIAPMMVFDWITLYTPLSYFNAIMAGIALISGGILLFYAITLLNKGFYKLTARYLHWNCKAIG